MQAQLTITPVPPEAARPRARVGTRFAYGLAGLAIASIWISVILASAMAPDLVSGSQQEHLPLVAFTAWLWGAIATGLVVLTALEGTRSGSFGRSAWVALGAGVSLVWLGVLLLSVLAPVFVTGSDPTRIPLVSMGAGILGVFGTWFVCLFVKASSASQAPATETIPVKLRELADLRDAGVITPQDFETTKANLLRRM